LGSTGSAIFSLSLPGSSVGIFKDAFKMRNTLKINSFKFQAHLRYKFIWIKLKRTTCPRINFQLTLWHFEVTKENYWILRIGVVVSCQKLGIILVTKWFKNWYCQKISIQKMCSKSVFFNEKNIEKVSDDFWLRKLTLTVKILHFWHLTASILKIQ
jgi:hypothetical protein